MSYVNDLPGSGGGGAAGASTSSNNTFTGTNTFQNQVGVAAAAGVVAQYIQAAASQTADLLRFLASDGSTVMAKVDKVGNMTAPTFVGIAVNPMIATPKTATYQILVTDSIIEYNNTGAFTTTMPDPTLCKGQEFVLVNEGTGTALITIAAKGSETFGAQAYAALHMSTAGESWTLMSDGVNWLILAHYCNTLDASVTPAWASTGTTPVPSSAATINTGVWRREGGDMIYTVTLQQASTTGATAGSGTFLWTLPGGYTNRSSSTTFLAKMLLSNGYCGQAGFGLGGLVMAAYDSTHLAAWQIQDMAFMSVASARLSFGSATAVYFTFTARIPIANWEP